MTGPAATAGASNPFAFSCDIVITNPEALREFALEIGGSTYTLPQAAGELVRDVVLRWQTPDFSELPVQQLECAIEQIPSRSWGGDAFTLIVHGQAADRDELVRLARAAYASNWFDDDWQPGSLDEAAFELLAASNPSPSPDECGFSFDTYRFGTPEPAAVHG